MNLATPAAGISGRVLLRSKAMKYGETISQGILFIISMAVIVAGLYIACWPGHAVEIIFGR